MKKIKDFSLIIPVTEVIAKAISFVNVLLLIRIFSISEYADYSYLISVILWASVLMDSGINVLVYNKSLKNDSSDLDGLFTGKIILSFIVVLLLGVFFGVKIPHLLLPGILLSLVILISSLSAFIKMYARGNHLIVNDLITILSEPIIRLFFLIMVFITNSVIQWKFDQFFVIYLIAGILAFVINYYALKPKDRFKLLKDHLSGSMIRLKLIIEKTKYFLLYYLMLIGLQRLDIIMLEKFGTKEELALFSTSITIYQVIYLFFYALITSKILFLIDNIKYLYKYMLSTLLIIVFVTFLISPYLYSLLFPQVYYNGHKVLNYLMISIIPTVFSIFFIIRNNFEGKEKQNFFIIAFIFVLKFIAYQIFKPGDLKDYYIIYGFTEFLLVLLFILITKISKNSINLTTNES